VLAVQASQKYRIALLQFRAENGMALSSKANLYTKGYLTKKDITENQLMSGDSSNQK
jgi:hypothetical protein